MTTIQDIQAGRQRGPASNFHAGRVITPRESGIGRRDQQAPYEPPRDFELVPQKPPRLTAGTWTARTGTKAWLETLDVPDGIVQAALNVDYEIGRTYEAPQALLDLGVPSLVQEGHREWERTHRQEISDALAALTRQIRDHAPDLYAQAREGFNTALDDGTDPGRWLSAAAGVRSFLAVRLVGRGRGPSRGPLGSSSHLWKLAHPDVWHQAGRPPLNGQTMSSNRQEWGVDLYTPEQVFDHLQRLYAQGYRPG